MSIGWGCNTVGIPSLILLLRIIVVLIHRLGNYSNISTMSAVTFHSIWTPFYIMITMMALGSKHWLKWLIWWLFFVIIKLMQAGSVERLHLYFVSIQYYYCLLALLFPWFVVLPGKLQNWEGLKHLQVSHSVTDRGSCQFRLSLFCYEADVCWLCHVN